MFCCTHDPSLASLLARNEEDMPDGRDMLLVSGLLAVEILCLVLGAPPW